MLRNRLKSFSYALRGIAVAWVGEPNFKLEVWIGAIAVLLGVFLDISRGEWAALILCIAIVLSTELLNTALEALCDMLQETHDPRVAIIKDLAAAAVFVVALGSLAVGLCIFIPNLFFA